MNALASLRDRYYSYLESYGGIAIVSIVSVVAAVLFAWQIYVGRGSLSPADRSALMYTLFTCDAIAFIAASLFLMLILYLSSLHYGDLRGLVRLEALALAFVVMVAPLAFIGGEIAFQPLVTGDHGVFIASVLTAASLLSGVLTPALIILSLRPRERLELLVRQILAEQRSAGRASSAIQAAVQRPAASSPSLGLFFLLKRLSESGDIEPVRFTLDSMAAVALDSRDPLDARAVSAAVTMVSHIAEAGAIGVVAGNRAVVSHAIDCLQKIASAAPLEIVSSAALRGIGQTFASCAKNWDAFPAAAMDPWQAGVYVAIYDATHRREPLDKAQVAAARALTLKNAMSREERARALYVSAQVHRRLAEIDRSEARARTALEQLEDALSCSGTGTLDSAFMQVEAGHACMALAGARDPNKHYLRAASYFEEAAKTLTPAVSPWDAAMLDMYRGDACTMLADEHRSYGAHDDALGSARGAIERYSAASRYFTAGSRPAEHGRIMSNAGLAHAVISEICLRSLETDEALEHARMAIECYSSALAAVDRQKLPESYAALKVSAGVVYVSIAEACFRVKRYEEAISACDSAIAAYNEALRTYEGAGQEKLARPARKHLKQANDLFNTFMMIGNGKGKPSREAA